MLGTALTKQRIIKNLSHLYYEKKKHCSSIAADSLRLFYTEF